MCKCLRIFLDESSVTAYFLMGQSLSRRNDLLAAWSARDSTHFVSAEKPKLFVCLAPPSRRGLQHPEIIIKMEFETSKRSARSSANWYFEKYDSGSSLLAQLKMYERWNFINKAFNLLGTSAAKKLSLIATSESNY